VPACNDILVIFPESESKWKVCNCCILLSLKANLYPFKIIAADIMAGTGDERVQFMVVNCMVGFHPARKSSKNRQKKICY
jgi:hypothetical protein